MTGEDAPIGVGVMGAGLAFQAIHARVLEDMAPRFAVRALWDPDAGRSAAAAQWLGARAAASCDDVLADPAVDVVVIASPALYHAEQTLAAIRSGKRAVLVEKPLCATPGEADMIAHEAQVRGTALLTGTMHAHDPAWLAAQAILSENPFVPALVQSSIVIPPNSRFEEWATEPLVPVTGPGMPPPMSPAQLMRLSIVELAIHDLPLVRRLVPPGHGPRVLAARLRQPFGYAVSVEAGGVLIDLTCLLHGQWQTGWTLRATGPEASLKIDFTPSFVAAGSAEMLWEDSQGARAHTASDDNGYAGLWKAIDAIMRGERSPPDPRAAAEDFRFAHAIAEQAAALIGEEQEI